MLLALFGSVGSNNEPIECEKQKKKHSRLRSFNPKCFSESPGVRSIFESLSRTKVGVGVRAGSVISVEKLPRQGWDGGLHASPCLPSLCC